MSPSPLPLSAADRLKHRTAAAAKLGWPHDALHACIAIERDYPGWTAFWTPGRGDAEPGYRAAHATAPTIELWAPTPEALVAAIEARVAA